MEKTADATGCGCCVLCLALAYPYPLGLAEFHPPSSDKSNSNQTIKTRAHSRRPWRAPLVPLPVLLVQMCPPPPPPCPSYPPSSTTYCRPPILHGHHGTHARAFLLAGIIILRCEVLPKLVPFPVRDRHESPAHVAQLSALEQGSAVRLPPHEMRRPVHLDCNLLATPLNHIVQAVSLLRLHLFLRAKSEG
eukprot:scaffold14454_cov122-Isochrysis_galbana.AAC.2